MMSNAIDWTPRRIAQLTRLWERGDSIAAIGHEMGISKNAVVGKAYRLNLPARRSPIQSLNPHAARPRRVKRTVPPPAAPTPASAVPPRVQAVTVPPTGPVQIDLQDGGCCWPIGEPGRADFHFCGAPIVTDRRSPYCETYTGTAYAKRAPRNADEEGRSC